MQPFRGGMPFLRHREGSSQISWVSIGNCSTSWFALWKRKKDASFSRTQPFPGGIPFFLTLRRQPANNMGLYWSFCNLLVCFVVQKKKRDAAISRTQPFPGGLPFFLFATFRRQLANYMGSSLVIFQPVALLFTKEKSSWQQ